MLSYLLIKAKAYNPETGAGVELIATLEKEVENMEIHFFFYEISSVASWRKQSYQSWDFVFKIQAFKATMQIFD